MLDRFQCLPRKLSRRGFAMATGAAVGGWFLKPRKVLAAGTPFTIALVPDPQFLAGDMTCSGDAAYNGLIQWAITNRNKLVTGTPLNIKGFIQVGDCCDDASDTTYSAQQVRSVNAYALAEAATPKMFVTRCAGNHDYFGTGGVGSTVNGRSRISYMWRNDKAGAWSPTNLASIYSGGMDLGNGDVAYFGGAYPEPGPVPVSSANSYFRLLIQGQKILVGSMGYFERSSVIDWMHGIAQAYPDHQVWICTHGYQHISGVRCDTIPNRGTSGDIGQYGPSGTNDFTVSPASNSGMDMWFGSDPGGSAGGAPTHTGFSRWENITGVYSGHWLDGYTGALAGGAGVGSWVWQRLPGTSTSINKQIVQQIFCNCQGSAGTGDQANYCSSNPATPDGTSDVMHLMLLRITPSTQMMEAFLVSTNSGKWTGPYATSIAASTNQASPIQLFNVSMAAPTKPYGRVLFG